MKKLCSGWLLLFGLGVALQAQPLPNPQASGLTTRERLDALIERVKVEQDRMGSLEAEFVQLKTSELLLEPEEARGVFLFDAPDSIRWEYRAPNPIVVLVRGDELITWYRDLGRAQKMKIRHYSDQVFKYLGASGSLETLMKYFTVVVEFPEEETEPYYVELTPRYARIAKRLELMEIWIDHQKFIPVRVRYVEPNGDHTEYRFDNLRVNTDIPQDRFELHLPPEVEVRLVNLNRPM